MKVFFILKRLAQMSECIEEKNERFADVNIPTALERRSVMVWGAISTDGKSELVMFQGNADAVRYQDEALQPSLLPFMNLHNRIIKFMQDGATRREQQECGCSKKGSSFSDCGGHLRARI